VKRAGLEFLFVKNDITNFLADSENILLIEEGLDLTDLSWREVLTNLEINQIPIEPRFQLKKPKDYLLNKINAPKEQLKKLSASRLQSYMDCPRKYYFSYVDKIDHRPEQRLSLGQDEMGTIEHDIIKKYFESLDAQISQPIDENKIKNICENEIDSYLSHSQIDLSFKTRQVHYFEILNSAKNAIAFLNNFIFEEKAYDIKFEVPLGENRLNLVGFIDCIVYLPGDYIAVFDFKRSSAAIGSKADTMNFNKVQIWVYLVVLAEFLQKKILAWGYINIAEPDESLVFYEKVKNILTPELLSESTNFISAKILEVKSEETFSPMPRNSKICQFCEVSLFCPKEVCK
jgi:ATP-dependent helicase/DNAse subunit B